MLESSLNKSSKWFKKSFQYNAFPSFFLYCSKHCVKSVQIRSNFWSVLSCIQSKYRKIRIKNNSVFGHFSRSENFQKSDSLIYLWVVAFYRSKQNDKTLHFSGIFLSGNLVKTTSFQRFTGGCLWISETISLSLILLTKKFQKSCQLFTVK